MVIFSAAVSLTVCISVCLARPAEHELVQSGSLDSVDPLLGFPTEYLPITSTPSLNPTEDISSYNLTLPINPDQHPDFRVEVEFSDRDRDRPRGIELVSSLATSIYDSWQDTANLRIQNPYNERQQPFSRFYYQIRASNLPGTSLTPLKVGLATCEILALVLTHPWWPGQIRATLNDASEFRSHQILNIGTIKIENFPTPYPATAAPMNPTDISNPVDSSSSSSNSLTIPSIVERRWLICFTRAFLYFVSHPVSGIVTDDPRLSPKPTRATYHFPCGLGNDQFDLTIDPAANKQSQWRLSWDRLIRAMLVWVNLVATQGEHQYNVQYIVKYGGIRQAALSMTIDPLVRMSGDGGPATS
ncbi:MAG: hypothetical protein LQ346_004769 [Caloplaca aetnensis]|nr:MAG: hypothetical protein LQ346_004769 [Caloplaca aetnensis]